ncbi:GGDEF domain-containing protein [Paenibacillus assamensis]|uniref:GGDEF domain-containing protein n=1 Tax=Paenibacillus assamensis TaxID=311244 RepID=UPI000425618B|nr:GGDEF domain-containing protein [Paenibacillus assamensis]
MYENVKLLFTDSDIIALTSMCHLYIMLIMMLMAFRLYMKQRSNAYILLFLSVVIMALDRLMIINDSALDNPTQQVLGAGRSVLFMTSFLMINVAILRLYKRFNRKMRMRFMILFLGVPITSYLSMLLSPDGSYIEITAWPLIIYQVVIALLCYRWIAPKINQRTRYTCAILAYLGVLLTIFINVLWYGGMSESLLITKLFMILIYFTIVLFIFFERIIENLQTTYRSSITDGLTGLYNRRFMYQRMNQYIAKSQKVSVIFCDIDNFKRLNDTKGHLVADEVLIKVAQIVRDEVDDCGLAGRFGGEEIIAFVQPKQKQLSPAHIAEQIRARVEEETGSTISIGYSSLMKGQSIEELVREADQAMYHSKQTGKNRVTCYQEIEGKITPLSSY